MSGAHLSISAFRCFCRAAGVACTNEMFSGINQEEPSPDRNSSASNVENDDQLSPTRATTSPGFTWKSTSLSAWTGPKLLLTPFRARTGVFPLAFKFQLLPRRRTRAPEGALLGDRIRLSVAERRLDLLVDDAEVGRRRAAQVGVHGVDGQGNTLYMFTNDEPGVTNCYDSCAENWPPLTVESADAVTAGEGVAAGRWDRFSTGGGG